MLGGATRPPAVRIDTGKLVKELRTSRHPEWMERTAVAAAEPALAFAAGWIGAGRERVRVETRAAWPDVWRSLAKKKRRFW